LKGFKKIYLEPGETTTVTFNITPDTLSFYNKEMQWIIEPGDFTIMVGTASDKLQEIKLKVEE
jgi:beta-glucosidase